MREEWGQSPYPGYKVSTGGKVLGPTGRVLSRLAKVNGYIVVAISGAQRRVHRLVLETFVGKCPEGMECRHLNGDRTDNRLANLAWGTRQQNADDSARLGVHAGENNGRAKLTAGDVKRIRELYSRGGRSQQSIADEFGISQVAVSKIILRQTWSNV